MGKRGPASKIKRLRVLSGKLPVTGENLGNSPAVIGSFEPPVAFNDEQRAVWHGTTDLLRSAGLLTVDTVILENFCLSYVESKSVLVELKKIESKSMLRSLITTGKGGTKMIHPLRILSMKLRDETLRNAIQLGMTPGSRSRLESSSVGVAEKKVNLFRKLKEEK
jgi:P27 family predicted phage terminase small subunit